MASKKVVIIDYGSGNLKSVFNAIVNLDICDEVIISDNPQDLKTASHIILPGVGAFADCMSGIKSQKGLLEEIKSQVLDFKKPFLGICVGMQVLADDGYENGDIKGLGLISGEVKNISQAKDFDINKYKIPQIGWNNLDIKKNNSILSGIPQNIDVYFANSYRFIVNNKDCLIASVNYGCEIPAIIAKDNILGIQFHPEKSGKAGLKFLENFILT